MTEANYRSLDAVNWSTLKAMAESPLHYLAACAVGRKDTPALAFGRLVDCLLFTPDEFSTRFVVSPYDAFTTKEARAWRDAQTAEVVKPDAALEARALADAVRAHPVARRYLDAGRYQVPLVWTDKDTGLRCKGLADLLGDTFLIDGKSTANANKRIFEIQAGKLKYHCQLAHYRNGYRAVVGYEPAFVGYIVYEKGPPYDVGVFELPTEALDAGAEEVATLLARVAECRAKNEWPGRYPEPVTLELPGWVFGEGEPEITFDDDKE